MMLKNLTVWSYSGTFLVTPGIYSEEMKYYVAYNQHSYNLTKHFHFTVRFFPEINLGFPLPLCVIKCQIGLKHKFCLFLRGERRGRRGRVASTWVNKIIGFFGAIWKVRGSHSLVLLILFWKLFLSAQHPTPLQSKTWRKHWNNSF